MVYKKSIGLVFGVLLTCSASVWAEALTDQLIVHYKDAASSARSKSVVGLKDRIARLAGTGVSFKNRLTNKSQVIKLEKRLTSAELSKIIQQLQTDSSIESVEPDYVLQLHAVPNDTNYSNQWNLLPTDQYAGSANAEAAWDMEKGDPDLVIAILDTGVLVHEDLDGRFVDGYDMIANLSVANDGDYRDTDATDPGNWCGGQNSNWHGTHVAGIIAASTDNAMGVSGINWNSKIQSVRVMGQCGGYTSDLVAGIRWAAGLPIIGSPLNSTPAKVINISAGSKASCSASLQSAIDDAVNAGVVVVASSGNDNQNASLYTPAGCNNVITVGAVTTNGARGSYSNYGNVVDISAPGGNSSTAILSTLNNGSTTPNADIYGNLWGTSMAAPHVTGAISLILSANPALTVAEVKDILQQTARDFPTGTGNDCNATNCGAGILDIAAAVSASKVNLPPVITLEQNFSVEVNDTVQLLATVGDTDGSVASILWQQTQGIAVVMTNADQANASFVAPATADILEFQLTVTDDQGAQSSETIEVTVNEPVNVIPAVNAGVDTEVLTGEVVNLLGSASDADGSIQTIQWQQTKGQAVVLNNTDALNASFTAPDEADILEFTLSVTDNAGASASDVVTIVVSAPVVVNKLPDVSVALDYEIYTGAMGSLTGMASDADGTIQSVQWQQISGTQVTIINAEQLNASFMAPADTGVLEFKLTVIDNDGAKSSATLFVTILQTIAMNDDSENQMGMGDQESQTDNDSASDNMPVEGVVNDDVSEQDDVNAVEEIAQETDDNTSEEQVTDVVDEDEALMDVSVDPENPALDQGAENQELTTDVEEILASDEENEVSIRVSEDKVKKVDTLAAANGYWAFLLFALMLLQRRFLSH